MDWPELLLLIAMWTALGAAALLVVAQLFGGRNVLAVSMGVFVAGFFARVVVIMLNEEFQFIEAKLAGDYSIGLYQHYILNGHGWRGLMGEQFAAQVLLNLPAWLLFGASRTSLLLSNGVVGAVAAPLAALLLYRDFGAVAARRALITLSLYPGGFNFSVFGLRDPLIFVAMIVMVAGGARIWRDRYTLLNLFLVAAGGLLTLWLRPELAYVVLVFSLIPLISFYADLVRGAAHSRKLFSSLLLITMPMVLIGIGAIMIGTGVAAQNIGAKTINPVEIANQDAVDRFERHESRLGGGSHMVDSTTYVSLPWYFRVPIQTVGLVLLPFPWQVTTATRLLAFGDSLFLISLIMFALVNGWFADPLRSTGLGRLSFALLFVFFIAVLGMGFVVSNSGNGFRMRLAVTPLIFVAACVCPVKVRFRLTQRQLRPALGAA